MIRHYSMKVDPIEIPLSGPPPCSVVFTGFLTPEQSRVFYEFVHDRVFLSYNLAKEFNEYIGTKELKNISLKSPKHMFDGTVLVAEVEVTTKQNHETSSNS